MDMTNRIDRAADKQRKVKSDSATVYKVMLALLLFCVSIAVLRNLRAYYSTIGGMEVLDPLTPWIAAVGFAGFAVCAVLLAVMKQKTVRAVLPWLMTVFAIAGITGVSMRLRWTQDFPTLYFLCCAIMVQYVIYQLYRWEFFLFSLSTMVSGLLFFRFSTGVSWSLFTLLQLLPAVAVLLLTALVAANASRHSGVLLLGKRQVPLFSSRFNPLLIYLADGLWLVCIAAALLLGGLFSYYCMFAAIAVEFIAAVYYTFQLN